MFGRAVKMFRRVTDQLPCPKMAEGGPDDAMAEREFSGESCRRLHLALRGRLTVVQG